MPKNNWREKFKEEFGIHFEDLSGELGFAIEFIKEEKELSFKKGVEKGRLLANLIRINNLKKSIKL